LLIMMSFTSTFEIFFKDAPILDAADDLPSRRGAEFSKQLPPRICEPSGKPPAGIRSRSRELI
jgi:hypothetical protein